MSCVFPPCTKTYSVTTIYEIQDEKCDGFLVPSRVEQARIEWTCTKCSYRF
jgi:hypothetical protein